MGAITIAWYAARAASVIARHAAARSAIDRRSTAYTNSAIDASQNATNGRSDSTELPFTTNPGVTRNNSVTASGCAVNRRAPASALKAAISEKNIYAP